MEHKNLYLAQLHCPNCGKQLEGIKCADGALRIMCPRCLVRIFSKQASRREIKIKVTTAN